MLQSVNSNYIVSVSFLNRLVKQKEKFRVLDWGSALFFFSLKLTYIGNILKEKNNYCLDLVKIQISWNLFI